MRGGGRGRGGGMCHPGSTLTLLTLLTLLHGTYVTEVQGSPLEVTRRRHYRMQKTDVACAAPTPVLAPPPPLLTVHSYLFLEL